MNKTLTKKDLTEKLAEEFGMTKKHASDVVEHMLATFTETLVNEGTVQLFGFGKFEVRHRAERAGINPATKERITIKASNSPAFKPAAALKKAVNQ